MKNTLKNVKLIDIPKVHDFRGKLGVVERESIPFKMQRIYYLYDVPSDAYRGGHAHKLQESILIALSGSFEVLLDDGESKLKVMLNKPDKGLYIPTGVWREIDNFSSGSVCLVVASTEFNEEDYIRDYKKFKLYKSSN